MKTKLTILSGLTLALALPLAAQTPPPHVALFQNVRVFDGKGGALSAPSHVLVPAQEYVGKSLFTFVEYPPSQKPGSFSLDTVMDNLNKGAGGK